MHIGKVKWFNNAKGYGFILPEHGGEDLFAHYSTIVMDGYKTLRAGQAVQFDIVAGPKGMHAVNICAMGDQPAYANGSVLTAKGADVSIVSQRHDPRDAGLHGSGMEPPDRLPV
jgi:CspA family cold shock protein